MNRFTGKWARVVVNQRWLVILLILAITAIAAAGFPKLRFYNNFISWLSPDDPVISLFVKTTEKFSTNEITMILVKPEKGVFTGEFLQKLKTFSEQLHDRREIFLVHSLANVSDIKKIEGGIEVRDLLEEVPQNAEETAAFRNYVLSKEGYKNNVVSGNGEWVAISVFISSDFNPDDVVRQLIFPLAEQTFAADGAVYYAGFPSDTYYLNKFAIKDITLLTPLIFLVIGGILFAAFRSGKGVLFPSLVVLLSSIWLFGMMGHLGITISFITTSIPVILTALGSAYGIHVLNKFNHDLQGPARLQFAELRDSTATIFIPVVLAGLTTFVGFLSFKSARLTLVADFGFYAAVGIVLALLIALSLIPALSSFTAFDKKRETETRKLTIYLGKLADFVIKRRTVVAVVAIVLLLLCAAGIPKLKKEINFIEYFPENSVPRQAHNISDRNFSGAYAVLFYLETENVKSPGILRLLRRGENFLLAMKDLSQPASLVSIIQELNFQMNNRYALPESAAAVGNLWFFIDGRAELKQLVTENNKETIIFSKTSQAHTRDNIIITEKLADFIRKNTRQGLEKFNLEEFSPLERQRLRRLEAGFLSEEVFWLWQHYSGRESPQVEKMETGRQKIKEILGQVSSMPYPEADPLVIRDYIDSESFDFFINDRQKEQIYNRLAGIIKTGESGKAALIKVLKELVPREEFAEEVGEDAATTMLFKLQENRENKLAGNIWQGLNEHLAVADKDFEKRIKSIIYDLLDNLVVLPAGLAGHIKGERVPLHFFGQSGSPALLSRLDHFLSLSQVQSLLLAYFVTLVLMVIMRRSLVLGLISTIPIVFTITVMYGFMGHTGIPLDYTTMMLGGISIGVGIDYAIHLVHGISVAVEQGSTMADAIKTIIIERGKAILSNAVAVLAGFAVLLLSTMLILRNFGATMMAALFLAALSALTVLPTALLILNPKIKKRRQ